MPARPPAALAGRRRFVTYEPPTYGRFAPEASAEASGFARGSCHSATRLAGPRDTQGPDSGPVSRLLPSYADAPAAEVVADTTVDEN